LDVSRVVGIEFEIGVQILHHRGGIILPLVNPGEKKIGFGGGLDVNLNPRVAVRILQADYVPTRSAGKWQNDFRVSIGVVFRFQCTGGR